MCGCDWGFARNSSAVVVISEAKVGDLPGDWPERSAFIPWIDEGVGVPYATFVRRVAEVARGYKLSHLRACPRSARTRPSNGSRSAGSCSGNGSTR